MHLLFSAFAIRFYRKLKFSERTDANGYESRKDADSYSGSGWLRRVGRSRLLARRMERRGVGTGSHPPTRMRGAHFRQRLALSHQPPVG
jgi:hypothetical protein